MIYSGRTSESEALPTYQQSEVVDTERQEDDEQGKAARHASYGCDEKFKMFGQLP